MKKILVSGIKPTGEAHLGSYFGMLKNCVDLQDRYQSLYFIADYHALTIDIRPEDLRKFTSNLAVDMISVGVDPKTAILFRQSDVPEHTELAWIFNCLTPVAELERMTQYKDMTKENKSSANAGLLTYPALQTADILLYRAEYVPVGEDQLQHLELSRIIARKFNNRYGNYFPEVKPILAESVRVMSLSNPAKKMSKHLGPKSYIALRDKPDAVEKKIAKAVTDSFDDSTTLSGGHNLLMMYKHFVPKHRFRAAEQSYKLKNLSYAELKKDLAKQVNAFLKPIQEKQRYYDQHPKEIEKILAGGAARARVIARKTISQVRRTVGLE